MKRAFFLSAIISVISTVLWIVVAMAKMVMPVMHDALMLLLNLGKVERQKI